MYSTQEVSRREISQVLEQASGVEKQFIAQKVAPIHSVDARAGRYPRITLEDSGLLNRDVTKRSSSGTYNEVTRKHVWDTYDCEDRGLEERIDDTKKAEMSNFFDMEVFTAKLVRRNILLDFEVETAKVIQNKATFKNQDAGLEWTDVNIETADVPADIHKACQALTERGEMYNTLVLSLEMFNWMRRSVKLQSYLYGKIGGDIQKRLINEADISSAFNIANVLVGSATYNTAAKGKATKLERAWKDSEIFLGDVKSGDFSNGGVARTLVWDSDVPNGLFATETYRDSGRRSDMVRVRSNSIEKIVNEAAGQLINTGR